MNSYILRILVQNLNPQHMKRFIIKYVHFSRKERSGAILLAFFCTAVFAFPEIARRFYPEKSVDFTPFQQEVQTFRDALQVAENQAEGQLGALFVFDPNTVSQEDFIRLGLSEKVARTICNYRDKGGKFRKPADFQKIWSLQAEDYERLLPYIRIGTPNQAAPRPSPPASAPEVFVFDPNTATENEFQRLGLPPWTIKSILNYRSKGGRFRTSDDFRKIYNLNERDFARLEPFVQISGDIALELPRPLTYSGAATATKKPLDINAANADEWQRLPGIGEKRAEQMVRFRDALGGFTSIDQVGEMRSLPDSVFRRIRPFLLIEQAAVKKIDLNAAAEADLSAHPYISAKQARLIVAYRDQHGAFASVDGLEKIIALSDREWLGKIRPYLTAK